MECLTNDHGQELLDLLFDKEDGILAEYGIDADIQQSTNGFKLWSPDDPNDDLFGLSDFDLTNSDLLPDNPLVNIDDVISEVLEKQSKATVTENNTSNVSSYRLCDSDHLYSRKPDEAIEESDTQVIASNSLTYFYATDDCTTESPIYFYPSDCSVASPQTDSTATDDCPEMSPHDSGRGWSGSSRSEYSEHSPLGMEMEDANVTNFVDDLLEVPSYDSPAGLISVDMNPDGVETSSDDNDSISNDYSAGGSPSFFSSFGGRRSSSSKDGLPFTMNDVNTSLKLSEEEMRLLAKEGVTLPTDLPLTKEEERTLKAVRRKIRNKVSAKTSRKRKQEYVDGLEKRVKHCSMQNRTLIERVGKLEKQNLTLLEHLKKLRSLISIPDHAVRQANGGDGTSASTNNASMSGGAKIGTGTCIMVLILSFGLFVVPNMNLLFDGSGNKMEMDIPIRQAHSRGILQHDNIHESADGTAVDTRSSGIDPYISPNPYLYPPYTLNSVSTNDEYTPSKLPQDDIDDGDVMPSLKEFVGNESNTLVEGELNNIGPDLGTDNDEPDREVNKLDEPVRAEAMHRDDRGNIVTDSNTSFKNDL